MIQKRFHKSDELLYCYNLIEYPVNTSEPRLFRTMVKLHAAPNVGWRDISTEIHTLRTQENININAAALMTVMVDYDDFIVALTLRGALKLINSYESDHSRRHSPLPIEYAYYKQVDAFAKEMVASRDFEEYKRSTGLSDKTSYDFLPKE